MHKVKLILDKALQSKGKLNSYILTQMKKLQLTIAKLTICPSILFQRN